MSITFQQISTWSDALWAHPGKMHSWRLMHEKRCLIVSKLHRVNFVSPFHFSQCFHMAWYVNPGRNHPKNLSDLIGFRPFGLRERCFSTLMMLFVLFSVCFCSMTGWIDRIWSWIIFISAFFFAPDVAFWSGLPVWDWFRDNRFPKSGSKPESSRLELNSHAISPLPYRFVLNRLYDAQRSSAVCFSPYF